MRHHKARAASSTVGRSGGAAPDSDRSLGWRAAFVELLSRFYCLNVIDPSGNEWTADRGPTDFSDLLLTPGVGARTVRALAMVAEVVHGAPYRFTDPARAGREADGQSLHRQGRGE